MYCIFPSGSKPSVKFSLWAASWGGSYFYFPHGNTNSKQMFYPPDGHLQTEPHMSLLTPQSNSPVSESHWFQTSESSVGTVSFIARGQHSGVSHWLQAIFFGHPFAETGTSGSSGNVCGLVLCSQVNRWGKSLPSVRTVFSREYRRSMNPWIHPFLPPHHWDYKHTLPHIAYETHSHDIFPTAPGRTVPLVACSPL